MRVSKSDRETVRGMFGGLCAYCGEVLGERWHVDHVEPIERVLAVNAERRIVATGKAHRPERHTITNMRPACPPCNIDKHTLSVEGWRRKLQDACNVLARNQPTYRHALRFGLVRETGAAITFHFERAASPIASRTVVSSPGAAIRVEALELTEAGREMLSLKQEGGDKPC